MNKTKEAVEGKDRWEDLNSYISLIEENVNDNPNIALDGSKSLLESVSKTILEDKKIEYKNDSTIGFLVKKAFESLPVFSKLSVEEINNTKSILGSFENISRNIGEFRNNHGFFAHGRDLQSKKFDRYLVELAISSADLLASFLIISHAEDLKDRSRVYYEENNEFNKYIDETSEELPVVAGYQLSPSQSLFTDEEAYKEELNSFINEKENLISQLKESGSFISTRRICAGLSVYKRFLTEDELLRIINSAIENHQIYRILGHGHTKNLFSWLLRERGHLLDASKLDEFKKSFSKASW